MKRVLFSVLVTSVGAIALTMGDPAHGRGDLVTMTKSFTPGTIVVRTNERQLYYVTGLGQAIRYPVGVGRAGRQWAGTSFITGKYTYPAWSPPAEVRRDKPNLPHVIPAARRVTQWASPP